MHMKVSDTYTQIMTNKEPKARKLLRLPSSFWEPVCIQYLRVYRDEFCVCIDVSSCISTPGEQYPGF